MLNFILSLFSFSFSFSPYFDLVNIPDYYMHYVLMFTVKTGYLSTMTTTTTHHQSLSSHGSVIHSSVSPTHVVTGSTTSTPCRQSDRKYDEIIYCHVRTCHLRQ